MPKKFEDYKSWYNWFSREVKLAIGDYFNREPLNLKDVVYSKSFGHEICIIQIRGKHIFPEVDPRYILNDPDLLECFSKKDLIKITALAIQLQTQQQENHYKLVEVPSENSSDAEMITVSEYGKGTFKRLNINDIDQDSNLQKRFTPSEAMLIAKQKARVDFIKELELLNEAKANRRKSSIIKKVLRLVK